MEWIRLTPESITAFVQVVLAAVIALYIFSLKDKSRILWLIGIGLIGETTHHFIKLVAFSTPALYQSATPLLGVSSLLIFVMLVLFAYEFREKLYPLESRVVSGVATVVAVAISGLLLYVFFSARPHDEIAGAKAIMYSSLAALILLAGWAIIVLLRKSYHFRHNDQPHAARGSVAFAAIISIKILIILTAALPEFGLVSVGFRIYANLVFHIVYLAVLTVLIIDHIQYPTSLQVKLAGLSLTLILLILSISALAMFSTVSLLDQSRQFIPNRTTVKFTSETSGAYSASSMGYEPIAEAGEVLEFGDAENVRVDLGFNWSFGGVTYSEVYVNEDGVLGLGQPYELQEPPIFYMEQLSPPYKSTISDDDFEGLAVVVPLHLQKPAASSSTVLVQRHAEHIQFVWNRELTGDGEDESAVNTFSASLYTDGSIDFVYEHLESNLHEGLAGIYPASEERVTQLDLETLPAQSTQRAGIGLDLSQHFRTYVHAQVLPILWLIIGSILFVLVIFPVALRASVFRPLGLLLGGVRRVDEGNLDEPVQVVARDEIGRVSRGFNTMMASLAEARQALLNHAESLEQEVALRTEEVEQKNQVLEEQAAKLRELDEIKSRFFANISHEFRTPLNLILGPVQSILDGDYGTLGNKLMNRHRVMLGESRRLLRLINQLLDLSKLEAGQMDLDLAPYDLVILLRRIVHSFSSRADLEDKTLTFQSDLEICVSEVDRERLETIGYNLIDNALKFTETGGKVRVTLSKDEEEAVIRVQDTGAGIPSDQLAAIFDRFHQVDDSTVRSQRGTGIGLALVKELVEAHRGTIDVESEVGFGSTFELRLPVRSDLEPMPQPDEPAIEASPFAAATSEGLEALFNEGAPFSEDEGPGDSRPMVLIVDDDPEYRAFLRESLEEEYQVKEAEDGQAGLDAAQRSAPNLIVSDLIMPNMDGVMFCDAIRKDADLDHIPFILLTAKVSIEKRIEGLDHGADDYLGKPIIPRELRSRIHNLLQQRQKLIDKYTDMVRLGPSKITVDSVDADLLKRTMEVIEAHFDDAAFSIPRLAEELGMSARDVQRKLKKVLDTNPKDLITTFRIERAKQLLTQQAGTVSQIAYKVGFRRPEYFARIFKQRAGVTPGEFMKAGA